jgi:hypothetical protein
VESSGSVVTRFRDIPRFTRDGSWECDFELDRMLEFIAEDVATLGLQLDPDFQRAHVWTEAQQIAWLEFFFRGGKTGRVIYLNHPGWQNSYKGEYVCVDGKQRIEAARRFLNNEITVFGSLRKEFSDGMLGTPTMKINVNTLKTRAEVLQWYIEMNAGGTPHTEIEIKRVKALLAKEAKALTPCTKT